MEPVAKAPRRYFVELMSALVLYFLALLARKHFAADIADPLARDILVLSPILPIVLAALAIWRLFNRIDEYRRRQMLEALAIAAAITCVISISWQFAVDIGAPTLSILWTWPIFSVFWAGTAIVFKLRDKASEGVAGKTILRGALLVAAVALATATYAFVADKAGWPASWPVLLLIFTLLLTVRVGYNIFTNKDPC
jgi:hypothetical protein